MATDAAIRCGLKLAELSDATKQKLKGALPATASLRNPVDVIGDARADRYKAAVRTVLEDENVDMGIVILTPQSMTDIEETAAVVPEAVKGHQQAGCLLVHGRERRGTGREDSARVGRAKLRIPRGWREKSCSVQLAGRVAGYSWSRRARLQES